MRFRCLILKFIAHSEADACICLQYSLLTYHLGDVGFISPNILFQLQKSWNLTTIQPSFGGTCSHNLQLTRVVASAPYVANFNPAIKRRILYATFVLGPIIGTFGYYVRELGWKKVQVSLNGLARFGRSVKTGMTISMDYWWTLNYTLRKAHEVSIN